MQKVLANLQIDQLVTLVVAWLPSLFAAILIFILFWALYRVTAGAVRAVLLKSGLQPSLSEMLVNIYRMVVFVFGGVMAAAQLGIDVAAALAGLGVVGLTIGFAAKDSLTNTIAGFLIFWDKPFQVGDWIELSDQYGKVSEITMRTTRIRTRRNTYVVVPNHKIIEDVLVNHSKHGETRVDVPVGIAYKESIDDARAAILAAVSSLPDVLPTPGPDVVVSGLGGSSVDLSVRVWIGNAERETPVYYSVVEASKKALDKAGIEIPFPHLQLFWDGLSDDVVEKAVTRFPLLTNGNAANEVAAVDPN